MSKQHPIILYIAEYELHDAVARTARYLDGEVLVAGNLLDALGMYTFYAPDIIVVDAPMGSWLAQEALEHLDSVGARPLVVLTDRRDLWEASALAGVYIRPREIQDDALLGTFVRALGVRPVL